MEKRNSGEIDSYLEGYVKGIECMYLKAHKQLKEEKTDKLVALLHAKDKAIEEYNIIFNAIYRNEKRGGSNEL